jgi:hypothetical protein
VTPAEEIRAALELAQRASGRITYGLHEQIDEALAALDALEAEHADKVWLTRDEAVQIRDAIGSGDRLIPHTMSGAEYVALALLSERMSVSQKQSGSE